MQIAEAKGMKELEEESVGFGNWWRICPLTIRS
jgi:hypothetical protein